MIEMGLRRVKHTSSGRNYDCLCCSYLILFLNSAASSKINPAQGGSISTSFLHPKKNAAKFTVRSKPHDLAPQLPTLCIEL